MAKNDLTQTTPRRGFLGSVATGAAAIGMATLVSPFSVQAAPKPSPRDSDADEWFNKIKGKHKIVYDVTEPHGVFPFAWPRIFLVTNEKTGTPAKDCSVVVVLRHEVIPYAMANDLWTKYKMGEMFKIEDAQTKAPSDSNPFWQRKPDDLPGIGTVKIGLNDLQESGVMFCVCNMAITFYSAVVAKNMNMDPATVKQEWTAGVLPGIQIVPSGVWAVGRAQEHGCAYCFVG